MVEEITTINDMEHQRKIADEQWQRLAERIVYEPMPPLIEQDVKLNLSYTINLVLPKTDDIAVFNSIFKSLRENLLRR